MTESIKEICKILDKITNITSKKLDKANGLKVEHLCYSIKDCLQDIGFDIRGFEEEKDIEKYLKKNKYQL